ncbi:(Na+)-NQR maturation NqrM [Thalassotalea sp. LPB0316]|uniref:(Na+)-NQR maturation NqrM n=1 Tax=Thalassotalea sp. LPB0316 TaxID=2769490 RepID=UPI001867E3F5|nr:(Na+)-NQR maturation NqrM [Thalassotalea sp. LPB0316]QOL27007.1 (Na+)-NQR maturation NqrM [Thalassotalea sp. LPB0316]
MTVFLLTLAFFLLVVVGMAVGYIFQKKSLAGSCGGLGTLGIDKACNCDNPCEKRQERERKAAELKENSINVKNL